MGKKRHDYAGTIERIADELETRRVPLILQTRRYFGDNLTTPRELATVRRQITEALGDEFRRDLERGPGAEGATARARSRNGDKIICQLREVVTAATQSADPDAFPKLVGDALRGMVTPGG